MTEKHYHAWRLWVIQLPVDAEGWIELVVRAWDSANNTQPTFVRSAWKCVQFIPDWSICQSRLTFLTAGTYMLRRQPTVSKCTASTHLARLRGLELP